MTERPHHRPATRGGTFFDGLEGGVDPAVLSEAADRAAALLVRGARRAEDTEVTDRVVHLADTEGLSVLADLWAGAAADTLAGCLWRLYALRAWVHANPATAASEYAAGAARAPVARVVAGVADPPGPQELRTMIDAVLRGIAERDFADVLFRAAAFARVVATGRAVLASASHEETVRMLVLSEQLEAAGHLELGPGLA